MARRHYKTDWPHNLTEVQYRSLGSILERVRAQNPNWPWWQVTRAAMTEARRIR